MANKNKRSKGKEAKAEAAAAKAAQNPVDEKPKKADGIFSRGQLTSLIFLVMGLSRLFQISNGIRQEDGSPTRACTHFFNGTAAISDPEAACSEDGFTTLLRYKYFMGWQVTVLAFACMLQSWHNDQWLIRLNVGFLVTPILTGIVALLMVEDTLVFRPTVRHQAILAVVMTFVGSPPSMEWIPFLGGTKVLPQSIPRPHNTKTLQSLMMVTMSLYFFFQGALLWGYPLTKSFVGLGSMEGLHDAASLGLDWINSEILAVATNTPASLVTMALMAIDKLTMAYIFSFAWFYLPEQQQRTMLLYTAVIHFITGTYLWPLLGDNIMRATEHRMVDFTIAAFGLLSWILPPLVWRKKID